MSRLLQKWLLPRCSPRGLPLLRSTGLAPVKRIAVPVMQTRYFQPVRLREYQEDCIQAVLSSLEQGSKRVGISLATGAGKTVIFTQLIDRVKPVSKHGTQTLILAHRRELVEQAARHCSNAYPGKTVEIEMGNMHASGGADITVASVQSIISGDRLSKFNPKSFKLVLVDEAHHIVAPGYLTTLAHFGLREKREGSPSLVGVSATFSRFDGLRLGTAIDEIVYHRDYVDMIEDKWLSDVIFTTVESTADISQVRKGRGGDFVAGELSKAVNTDKINEIIVRCWLLRAAERKSTLVFCVDLTHVASLTRVFRQHGVDARFITSDTSKVERGERLDAFRNGEYPVLVNCGVFTEGTDIPNIDCVVLARPTRSRNLLVQMIGRGMRLHPGKKNCHVIDMVASLSTGIVTTPTLFGLDPSELMDNATVDDMKDLKSRRDAEQLREAEASRQASAVSKDPKRGEDKIKMVDYDSVLELIADTSSEKHIRQISHLAWVKVGPHRYILNGQVGAYLKIDKIEQEKEGDPEFAVWEIRPLPRGMAKSPYARPKTILTAATLDGAVHGADHYALEQYAYNLVARNVPWRSGTPSTHQLDFLNRLRGDSDAELDASNLTKGQAMDMMTKIRHGARGQFANISKEKRKAAKKEKSLEQVKLREKVSVGPLAA